MSVSIALDVGGTNIKGALVQGGKILAEDSIPVSDNNLLAPLLPVIRERIASMARSANVGSGQFGGIGMAFPCIVDSRESRILSEYVKYRDINDLALNAWAANIWGIPLRMENDARAALVGEWQFGAGKGIDNLVQITIGTGVGSAVLIEGRLLRGKHYVAGNLGGHMTVKYDGSLCNCGNIGCLETVASTWSLPEIARKDPGFGQSMLSREPSIDFRILFDLAKKGDELSCRLRDDCIKAWSFGIVNLVHAFDPERIIVGGGIMKSRDILLPHFRDIIDRHTWLPPGTVEVVAAENENNAALLGMAYLIEKNE